jgi:Cysteine-rich secretory protein family
MRADTAATGTVSAIVLAFVTSACSPAFPDAPTGSTTSNTPPSVTAADLAFCVGDVNRYRAQVGRPPLVESPSLEAFAAAGAQADAASGVPHSHFRATNGGGIASAENELLTFDRQLAPTVQDAMHAANAIFWAEGSTGAHYQILVGSFTEVGCGVFVTGGAVTVVQDFR